MRSEKKVFFQAKVVQFIADYAIRTQFVFANSFELREWYK